MLLGSSGLLASGGPEHLSLAPIPATSWTDAGLTLGSSCLEQSFTYDCLDLVLALPLVK